MLLLRNQLTMTVDFKGLFLSSTMHLQMSHHQKHVLMVQHEMLTVFCPPVTQGPKETPSSTDQGAIQSPDNKPSKPKLPKGDDILEIPQLDQGTQ
jgi:hypothetical protein